tara:strand:+ start:15438 stop:15947 length:510 start_codon:yes stop_codon:yes gene_type:complete
MNIVFDIETTGLDPLKDRIIAIGVKIGVSETAIIHNNEKKILEEFWNCVKGVKKSNNSFRLIGFNSNTFDIPFILIRSFKHNVKIEDVRGRTIDLRYLLSYGNRYQNGKLSDYAELIDLEQKYNGYDGSDMPLLWEQGKIDEIQKYVLLDIKITNAVFKRAQEIGLVNV